MKTTLLFLMLAAAVVSAESEESNIRPRTLTLDQARSLARVAAESAGFSTKRGFSLEYGELEEFPAFYYFSVLLPLEGAEGSSANYAVNKYTGEVWKPFRCRRVSSARLSKLRKKLLKEVGVSKEELRRHQNDIPCLS